MEKYTLKGLKRGFYKNEIRVADICSRLENFKYNEGNWLEMRPREKLYFETTPTRMCFGELDKNKKL